MKIVLLNGAPGAGKREAARQFKLLREHARILSVMYLTFSYLRHREWVEYILDAGESKQLIRAVELVGVENVCLVNVFRPHVSYFKPGLGGTFVPIGYDRKIGDGPLEHLDFNLYNDGPLDRLGEALAHIVECWENGATFVEKHTGA